MPRVTEVEPAESPFSVFMRDKGWVIDLEEFRSAPRRYAGTLAADLVAGQPQPWLVVPLLVGDDMLGFVLLARPAHVHGPELGSAGPAQDRRAPGRRLPGADAGHRSLLEARKFEAFNRMSAFVVHDLKNIVTQLSLMLKNAERLRDNPEFQQDMLLTVESSLEKMKPLMLQLREGATPPGGSRGVELGPILRRLEAWFNNRAASLKSRNRKLCPPGATTTVWSVCWGILCKTPWTPHPPPGVSGLRCGPLQRPGQGRSRRYRCRHVRGLCAEQAVSALQHHQTQRHGHRHLREFSVHPRTRRQRQRGQPPWRWHDVMTCSCRCLKRSAGQT
jgi:hypothetical protein